MLIHHRKPLPSGIKPLVSAIVTCLALSAMPSQAFAITVMNANDSGLGSLRQAILDTNNNNTADTIDFDAGLDGSAIILGLQIDITDTAPLIIDASTLANGITVSGNNASRIFGVTEAQKLTLNNLTVTAGHTTATNTGALDCSALASTVSSRGGAICAEGELELIDSTISNSSTAGSGAEGGGIFSNVAITLTNSTVSGNSTAGDFSHGGGGSSNVAITLTNSTVSGNSTTGGFSFGGGFFAYNTATLTNSTISGNSTTGLGASGGGGFSNVAITLTNSTVSGNSTAGITALGGGFCTSGTATLTNSTVSGNSTAGLTALGGGFCASGTGTALTNSTITQNIATNGAGDGIYLYASAATLNSTILSGNGTDNFHTFSGILINATNSLFGDDPSELNTDIDNIFNNNPGLAALADNGCAIPAGAPATASCVQTHALLVASPALDVGLANGLATDQRGTGFPRTIGSQTDIGAFEHGVPAPTFEKAFSPASIPLGESSTLIFTITNLGNASLTGLNFTDSYPADMFNTDPLVVAGTCGSIVHSAVAGGNTFNLTGATINAGVGTTCTVTVDVTGTSVGAKVNTATDIGSTESGAGTDDAEATLTITSPPVPPAPAEPIPTISAWGLGILASLLGLMGFVRRRKT